MKLRNPSLIRLVAFLASWLVRVWLGTLRYRFLFMDGKVHPTNTRTDPGRWIYSFWHETLPILTHYTGRIHVLISQHADGELIARLIQHLGFRVIRGSTTRGGATALLQMMERSADGHLAITPDGPRGPRRYLQPGAIFLASATGKPILPAGVACDRAWRLKSWDRMWLPKPWSTTFLVVGKPIYIPAGLDRAGIEHYRALVEEAMRQMTDAAEKWANGEGRPRIPDEADGQEEQRRAA